MENGFRKIELQYKKYGNVQGLMQYINKDSLIKQHRKQLGNKATGIDKITKYDYHKELNNNIENLLSKMKTMSYKPKAVRRTYIPKTGSNELRPLGIPAYEDKLVQGAMAEVLRNIYENIFLECSFGFRPNKDCHKALKELDRIIMWENINYIVDADIKGFFNNVNHEWLIKFLEHTIKDRTFIRYIARFLKAGIIEDMQYYESDRGTPQGGLILPILANVYLHYVLDLWFEKEIKAKCKGKAFLIRYADDFVCCFQYKSEAEKFYKALKERINKFDLQLAEDKSKIIPFGRNTKSKETFDFLGFTHKNGKSRKGLYKLIHHTSNKKARAKKENVKLWLKEKVYIYPIPYLIKKLNTKLIGMYRYYGISDNIQWLIKFRQYVRYELKKWLSRRSQRGFITWEKYNKILKYNPIATPKIYHSLWQFE